MPFRSQAQWRWAFATGQEWADEWAKMTPGGKRKFLLLQKRVGASKAIESLKHLPGKHDQRKHGRDGGGGSGGISGGSGVSDSVKQIADYRAAIQPLIDSNESYPIVAARFEASRIISTMDEQTQLMLINDDFYLNGVTLTALATFGTPIVRDIAARKYYDKAGDYVDFQSDDQPYSTFNSDGIRIDETWQFMRKNCLEYAELVSTSNRAKSTAEFLWKVHAGGETGLTTAQLQMALSNVGPNADVPRSAIRSFYPDGITTPQPQPRYVAALQETYAITQAQLAQDGITSVKLHRGSDLAPGLALEPWTPLKGVASTFAKFYNQGRNKYESKIVVRSATIPAKYMLATWKTAPGWDEDSVRGKQEHMVAGLAYANDTGLLTTKDAMKSSPAVVDLMTYDIYFNYRLKPTKPTTTRTKAIAERRTAVALKHLPGRHNQQAHGRRGGASGGSASAFTTWNDREVAKMNQDLRDIVSADPVTYTAEQKRDMSSYLQFYVPVVLPNIVLDRLQRDGIPFDAAMQLLKDKKNALTKMVETKTPIDMKQLYLEQRIQLHYREQNVRFSRLTKEEQDAVFSKLKDRVAAKDPTLTHDDMDMLVTAGLYGHPQMRMDAYKTLVDAKPLSINKRQIEGENGLYTRVDGSETKLSNALGTYEYYSLDYRMMANVPSYNNAQGDLSRIPTSGDAFNQDVDFFMRAFTRTHVMENTENVLGAAIQSHMSQVGPNADAPRPPSFYPRGVKTPEPNPVIVAYLNEQYRQTQAELSASGTTSTQLYRGTASDFRLGIPMSPWSDTKSVSMRFGDVLNQATIPNKYVFMNHWQDRFNKTFVGENEWLMLETGMMGKTRRKPIAGIPYMGGTKIKPAYELTVKAMHDIPFDGSLLEQQYDIFYNFREKPTKKRQKSLDSHIPPASVRASAKRGLELRSEFGRGGTAVGIARARDLSNGKGISSSTIKRMVSFFARHAVDKRPDWANPSKPSNGYIAHLLWGGDAGRSWANKISRKIDAERTRTKANIPNNPALWKRAIAQAKRKFDVYPSRYANQWASNWYKKNGGEWSAERAKADDVTADGKPKRYSAGGGEVITGNLGRDSSGRFTNIRGAQALTQRIITRGDGPKKKRGGGRAKLSPEQAKAQRDKIGKDTIKKFGFSSDDYDALSTISDDPISVDSADTESVKKLIESNLAEVVGDVVALTTLGKRVLKVSQSGKAGAVREVIARDAAKRDAQNKKRAEQNQSRVDNLNEQIASYEDKIADKKTKPRTRAIAERKLARAKAKLAELTTTKSRLKHLPGKHNQQSHGRDGGGGGGGISGGSGILQETTKLPKDMTDDEFMLHLDDERSYPPQARQGIVAAREHIKQKLAGDDSDFDSKQLKELSLALKLDPQDADTPAIIAGLFGIQIPPGAISTEILISGFGFGEIKVVTHNFFDDGTQSTIARTMPTNNNKNVVISNNYAKNNTPVRGMGYANLRQQAYAAMLLNKKTGKSVSAKTKARSTKSKSGWEEWQGVQIWPLMGVNFDIKQNPLLSKSVSDNGFNGITSTVQLMTARNASGQTGASLWGKIVNESRDGKGNIQINGKINYTNRTNNPGLDILVEYGDSRYRTTTKALTVIDNELDLTQSDLDLLISLWNAKANPVSSRTKAISERRTAVKLKHLPGKHDQSTHGRPGRGGGGGIAASRAPKVKPQTPSAVAGSADPELMAYATKFAQETEALRRARLYDADGNYIATEEQRIAFHAELVKRGEMLANKLRKDFGLSDTTPYELTFDPEVDAKYDEVVRTALRQPISAPISFVMNEFPELQQVLEARVAPYVHMAPPDRNPVAIIEKTYGPPEGGYYTSVAHGEESGFNVINLYGKSPDIAAHEYGHYIECEKVGSGATMRDFTVARMGESYVNDLLNRSLTRTYGMQGDITSPGKFPVMYPYSHRWYYGKTVKPGSFTPEPAILATEVVTEFLEHLMTPRHATRSVQFTKMFGYIYATLNY